MSVLKIKIMKQKLLNILKERGEINITDLHDLIPEINGQYTAFMPTKPGLNPNIIWMTGIKNEFIKVLNDLMIVERKIQWVPVNVWDYSFSNSRLYNKKIADPKYLKTKTECWLPIKLILSKPCS